MTSAVSTGTALSAPKGALVYFTTAYPNVSHTFIRREILGLEALGYRVLRVALRCGDAVVDPLDERERARTLHMLQQPAAVLVRQVLGGLLLAHWRLGTALVEAWRLHRNGGGRGLLRHTAYLVEALALLWYLRANGAYHVHVHFGTNAAAVVLLTRLMGGPTFSMTVHGPDEFDAPLGFSLGRKMRAASFTAAISSYCAAQLKRWVDYREWDKIHVVRCTVEDGWLDAARPIEEAATALVTVGRLSAQKGQLLLVDAYADAVARGVRARLVIIGDGELREPIERRIVERGMQRHIELTGWLTADEIRSRLLASRALVLPSFAEGLPVVLMEAMALTRPVVASAITGVPELVKDGTHGWLVVAGDRDALATALLAVDRASLSSLRAMGEAGRDAVYAQHTARTELPKLEALFGRYASANAARRISAPVTP